jgi:hypothetical protein
MTVTFKMHVHYCRAQFHLLFLWNITISPDQLERKPRIATESLPVLANFISGLSAQQANREKERDGRTEIAGPAISWRTTKPPLNQFRNSKVARAKIGLGFSHISSSIRTVEKIVTPFSLSLSVVLLCDVLCRLHLLLSSFCSSTVFSGIII